MLLYQLCIIMMKVLNIQHTVVVNYKMNLLLTG